MTYLHNCFKRSVLLLKKTINRYSNNYYKFSAALNPETQRQSRGSSYGPEVPVGVRVVADVLVRDVPPLQQVLISLILQEKHTSCSGVHTHTHTACTV